MNDMDRQKIKNKIKALGQQYVGLVCRYGLGSSLAVERDVDVFDLQQEIARLQQLLDDNKRQ